MAGADWFGRKKRASDGIGLGSVYAVLARAYGWRIDDIESLTMPQAELFAIQARKELELEAELHAKKIAEQAIDILKAMGIVR